LKGTSQESLLRAPVPLRVSAAGFNAGRSFLLLSGLLFPGLFLRRFLFRGLLCRGVFGIRFLLLATPAPDRRRGEQFLAFFQRQRFRFAVLGHARILGLVRNVRAISTIQHLNTFVFEILNDAIGILDLLGFNQFEGAWQLNRIRVVVTAE